MMSFENHLETADTDHSSEAARKCPATHDFIRKQNKQEQEM